MHWARQIIFLLLLGACSVVGSAFGAADWKVVKVSGWDYLSVENVARFYGFAGSVEPINRTVRLDNGANQLEVTLDSREAIVNGVRNWLCFPVIEREGKYLISRIDLAKTIEPQFRPHMIRNLGRLKTVVIDPGHGGPENGAGSSFGREKDFTLDVAKKLKPLLEARGLRVVMTRDRDELVPLPERARIANNTRDSVFVSIHFNATDYNSSATGFEIYSLTPRGAPSTQDNAMLSHFVNMQAGSAVDANSLVLSTSVYHAMLGYLPEFDRGIKRARFAVLRLTNIPAILVEGGFLTERDESKEIADAQWRTKLAEAIATGIDGYRNLLEKKQRPLLLADYRRQFEGVLVARDATAPLPGSTPPVFPASNPAVGAQVTQPLHRQPSPQITVTPEMAAALESAPSHEGDEGVESAEVAANAATPAPVEIADEMPTAAAAPETPAATAPTPEIPIVWKDEAAPAAAAPMVRRSWVLKFDPPPKFRE